MKVGSLFSGIGGIDFGFEQAGFEIAWANEIDQDACKTYLCNFPNTKLIEGDIKTVNFSLLEKVDVITAGFPCQPFSVCGKKKGFSDERGNLFFEIMRAADVIKPAVIFLENVANLVKHDNGRTFNVIHNEISSRNYEIRYIVADACDYGIPQHRTRTYIAAFKTSEATSRFKFPEKRPLDKHVFDVIDKSKCADDCLYLRKDSGQYRQMENAIIDDGQVYRFSDYGIQKGKDGISFTLKANMGTWYNREPYIKDNYGIRRLSPEECLLLQGFPSGYKFGEISEKSKYKQVGNSVCVPIIAEIAENISSALRTDNKESAMLCPTRSRQQLEICLNHNFYYMPNSKLPSNSAQLEYIVLPSKEALSEKTAKCYFGRIIESKVLPRSEIKEPPKNSDTLYTRFEIECWKESALKRDFPKWFTVSELQSILAN